MNSFLVISVYIIVKQGNVCMYGYLCNASKQASNQSTSQPNNPLKWYHVVRRTLYGMLYIVSSSSCLSSSSKTRPPSLLNFWSCHHPLCTNMHPFLLLDLMVDLIIRDIHPKPPHAPLVILFLAHLFLPKRNPLIPGMHTTRRPTTP